MNMKVLCALTDILDCGVNDLIEVTYQGPPPPKGSRMGRAQAAPAAVTAPARQPLRLVRENDEQMTSVD